MKLNLSIDDIQLAYTAVDNQPHLELTKHTILQKLDVETFQETYELEFTNAEFEQTRIAVGRAMSIELNIDDKQTMTTLYDRLMEVRSTL